MRTIWIIWGPYHRQRRAVLDAFNNFVWLYPTKTTSSAEVISKILRQSAVFDNPRRMITDRGTAFTSSEFETYCEEERIRHSTIITCVFEVTEFESKVS